MDTTKLIIVIYWISVGFYVLATFFNITSWTFKKDNFLKYGAITTTIGFIPHSAALVIRWIQAGHAPYWGLFEVFPAYAWMAVLIFIVVIWTRPNLRSLGAIIMPIIFLMIGIGVMAGTKDIQTIPRTFYTYWLGVHIIFAKLAYGSALIASVIGVFYVFKDKQISKNKMNDFFEKLPDLARMDLLSYRFAAFSFIMLGIMIASGAIWAYKAWGRYWGWDPIETWALISWFTFGIYLHLRLKGWKGLKAAWLMIFILVLLVFAFFGVPLVYDSVHEHLGG